MYSCVIPIPGIALNKPFRNARIYSQLLQQHLRDVDQAKLWESVLRKKSVNLFQLCSNWRWMFQVNSNQLSFPNQRQHGDFAEPIKGVLTPRVWKQPWRGGLTWLIVVVFDGAKPSEGPAQLLTSCTTLSWLLVLPNISRPGEPVSQQLDAKYAVFVLTDVATTFCQER